MSGTVTYYYPNKSDAAAFDAIKSTLTQLLWDEGHPGQKAFVDTINVSKIRAEQPHISDQQIDEIVMMRLLSPTLEKLACHVKHLVFQIVSLDKGVLQADGHQTFKLIAQLYQPKEACDFTAWTVADDAATVDGHHVHHDHVLCQHTSDPAGPYGCETTKADCEQLAYNSALAEIKAFAVRVKLPENGVIYIEHIGYHSVGLGSAALSVVCHIKYTFYVPQQ